MTKRGRTSGGEEEGEPVAVAAGFEAPIFGARTVGQVTTLALEGEDGPLASLDLRGVASDHAGGWYVATWRSVLHVSSAGRVRTVTTCEGGGFFGLAISPDDSALQFRENVEFVMEGLEVGGQGARNPRGSNIQVAYSLPPEGGSGFGDLVYATVPLGSGGTKVPRDWFPKEF
ncbi:hypothetical protein EMIHUDRAFT_247850 [Emiliania huxleyi CCMP1516]|uniref:NECAP PHear domain-containing protein n=2 Tax=Emiliania huxleyi TaxID=2903 RepID=A0A0D3IJS9_EMIH1|nr:hypothetical protein EMIHUDRAFT_247850 [Emiliania huxleyi CCMP1516]EOD11514.1 hypothetical protein EMIHUDRAFT_247850 [Emiliania huxleyi CCMP1516]|eukprot:XP_005763943.1 hypothetical protein EMIHUDRAFT_247850 [Emiliania huxleyi CCMP1516]